LAWLEGSDLDLPAEDQPTMIMEEQIGPFQVRVFTLFPGCTYLDVTVEIEGQREVFHSSHATPELAWSAWETLKAAARAVPRG
jgi:hypothetical protein